MKTSKSGANLSCLLKYALLCLQCLALCHTHLTPSTNKKSSRRCWTWESVQWRASPLNGITRRSSGKVKRKQWGPVNILECRPIQNLRKHSFLYLSDFNYTSVCAFGRPLPLTVIVYYKKKIKLNKKTNLCWRDFCLKWFQDKKTLSLLLLTVIANVNSVIMDQTVSFLHRCTLNF